MSAWGSKVCRANKAVGATKPRAAGVVRRVLRGPMRGSSSSSRWSGWGPRLRWRAEQQFAAGSRRSPAFVRGRRGWSRFAGRSGRVEHELRVRVGWSGGTNRPLVRVDGCEDGRDDVGVVDGGDGRELRPRAPRRSQYGHFRASMVHTLIKRSGQLMRSGRLGATGAALSAEGVGTTSARRWWCGAKRPWKRRSAR